jgi:subtilisin family serine protease
MGTEFLPRKELYQNENLFTGALAVDSPSEGALREAHMTKKIVALIVASLSFAARADAVLDEVFVRWKPEVTPSERVAFNQSVPAHSIWASTLVAGLERVKLHDGVKLDAALASYRAQDGVLYAEPVRKVERRLAPMPATIQLPEANLFETIAGPNDPMFSRQWALNNSFGLMPFEAWKVTKGAKAIKVAIIDTGISPTHPELQGKVAPGFDFIARSPNVGDSHGHGTHVAGIIGANTDNGLGIAGINAEVTLIPIRAVPDDGDETDANVVESFEFAANAGARVANCSFGKAESSRAVADAIEAAGRKGLLAVVAAGNESQDNNVTPAYPASFRTSNMVVVAATTDRGTLAFFSNYGMNAVDLAAPGSNILSTVSANNGYASWSGTSMAAPQVAGVAALALAANPGLSVDQLRDLLLASTTALPALSGRVTTGGTIDASKAVQAALALPR